PYSKDAQFDYAKFYEVTYESQRLMDDLVELELEAIERILNKIDKDEEPVHIKRVEKETWQLLYDTGKKARRTGLGFTGLGDAFAAMGYSFDSSEAMELTDNIMKCKCKAEFNSSTDMAVERGQFESFDPKHEEKSEFNDMLKTEFPELHERMMKNGRRNISISTVAPTGTLSMLTQTTSGIEPAFMLSYKRRRKVNPDTDSSKVSYVDDLGDKWEEFTVYHHKLKTWMDKTGETDIEKSPYQNSTASEINWLKRVELQSIVQKYVTHSISSTINLPNDVSPEKVGD
ncbi:MAG: ribonucleoside-diphosphate reductase, adenosylcobalamin-dependent, partial [Flavobacteriales bacterium]